MDENAANQDRPLPWWVCKTTRWGGETTVGPFWRIVHVRNLLTQLRGWYWKKRGY